MIPTSACSSGVAAASQAYRSIGTPMSRPSVSRTLIRPFSTLTEAALGLVSAVGAEVLTPSPQQKPAVRNDDPTQPLNLARIVAANVPQTHRRKPEDGHAVSRSNVDMRRLVSRLVLQDRAGPSRHRGRRSAPQAHPCVDETAVVRTLCRGPRTRCQMADWSGGGPRRSRRCAFGHREAPTGKAGVHPPGGHRGNPGHSEMTSRVSDRRAARASIACIPTSAVLETGGAR
jgi:hypothetical protein